MTDWERIGFVNGNGTTSQPNSYSFADNSLSTGKYFYRLKQIDFDGSFTYSNEVEVDLSLPQTFSLEQSYPNPFNPSTTIKYTIPNVTLSALSRAESRDEGSRVILKVYDILGNEVATLVNENKPAGNYEINFNASSLTSGIYFYTIQAGSFTDTKKMTLLK